MSQDITKCLLSRSDGESSRTWDSQNPWPVTSSHKEFYLLTSICVQDKHFPLCINRWKGLVSTDDGHLKWCLHANNFTIITQFKTYSTARGRHCFVLVHLWLNPSSRLFLEMEFSILWTQKAVSTKLKRNPVPSPKVFSREIYKLFQLFSSLVSSNIAYSLPCLHHPILLFLPSVFFSV